MNAQRKKALAHKLDEAVREARAIPQLSSEVALSIEDAYAVQAASIERRLDRGETMAGVKMGFTSRAKMVQMGVSDLIWGRLTSGMRVEDGGTADVTTRIHPRIEPEIAFLLGAPLSGPVSPAEAALAVTAVAPAMEIIDSRYEAFQFSLPDVIADNASASGFVLGPWCDPKLDLANLGMVMEVDGTPVQIGSTAAILGHPLRSLAAASRLAAEQELVLEPGWIVLAGGATAAVVLEPGRHVRLVAEQLGQVQVSTRS
jgi:2-oxo-3-hexenedioate decarboxylase